MRFVLVVGTTHTATIEGISAAGANSDLMLHTPAADVEIVEYGQPVLAPVTPVSPAGCPTPAVVTRGVRDLVGFDVVVVDAGLATRTAAPTVTVGERPGADVRDAEPVPTAVDVFKRSHQLGQELPDEELVIGESIPGGTTTALGVLSALGEPHRVSSSLSENPIGLKQEIVTAALEESGLQEGELAGDPVLAMRLMGDPVLAAVTGLALGAVERDAEVTLAGGTQMIATGALIRHFDVHSPVGLATTSFVADDETADLRTGVRALEMELTVTDPGFDQTNHVALERYRRGEAKEGVGMGGALMLAEQEGIAMSEVRDQIKSRYETLVDDDGS